MIDKIKWWIYSKCLGWQITSRYKFIRLSKWRELYIHYSWDTDKVYLTIHSTTKPKKNIVELTLNSVGTVTRLENNGNILIEEIEQ